MKAEDYRECQTEAEGWPVRLTSYRIGEIFYCQADNVSPGSWLARTQGSTREEAEQKALALARQRLSRTKRPGEPP